MESYSIARKALVFASSNLKWRQIVVALARLVCEREVCRNEFDKAFGIAGTHTPLRLTIKLAG